MPIIMLEPEEKTIINKKGQYNEYNLFYRYDLPIGTLVFGIAEGLPDAYIDIIIRWRDDMTLITQSYLIVQFDENLRIHHFFLNKILKLPIRLLTILYPRHPISSCCPDWIQHYDCTGRNLSVSR